MELINLLERSIPVFQQTYGVSLNWIGNLIRLLISGVGVVGVGIILFSLILKCITLPFDIFQRITMRKQNNKMKENKEKMEKLKKQYANDEKMYNQKVAEMYRESGMSVFSSCLPMILSLVIFIVAINAFNAYAQYSNVQNYNTMVNAYNAEMKSYCAQIEEENIFSEGDKIVVKDSTAEGVYLYYKVNKTENFAFDADGSFSFTAENIALIEAAKKEYYIDLDKAYNDAALMEKVNASRAEGVSDEDAVYDYFVGEAQSAVVDEYNTTVKKNTQFLWIKNIWATDASYKHPVLKYSDFKSEAKQEKFKVNGKKVKFGSIHEYTDAYGDVAYEMVTEKLDKQKKEANGYYILIALSIGTILLQQFVMMRSQKEQQQFSTVDGQGAGQQKIMMVVMTGMFAIFSFMYSSAFTIYMVTSNVFSMLSTLVINKCVDKAAEKKEATAAKERIHNHSADRIERAKQSGKASAQARRKRK